MLPSRRRPAGVARFGGEGGGARTHNNRSKSTGNARGRQAKTTHTVSTDTYTCTPILTTPNANTHASGNTDDENDTTFRRH